ncbi:MAG: DUF349 domain-containing protein [Bacteroidales bacterium]|nr:DUF349 domain-containing protein [Bacteroidales bacterium]
MENKDQLNQIPVDPEMVTQDEKTSQTLEINVEASPVADSGQENANTQAIEVADVDATEAGTSEVTDLPEMTTMADEAQEVVEPAIEQPVQLQETETKVQPDEPANEELVVSEVEPVTVEENPEAEMQVVTETAEEISDVETQTDTEKVAGVDDSPVAEEVIVAEAVKEELPEEQVVEGVKEEEVPKTKESVTAEAEEVQHEEEHDEEDEEIEHDEHADLTLLNYDEMTREELIENLEALVHEDDVTKMKSRIALIKVAFLRKSKEIKETGYQKFLDEGGEKEAYAPESDDLETKFNSLFDIYRQKRAVYLDNLETEKITNLKKKQEILDALKELINSEETLKKTYDDFRDLQENWRQIGMVPKAEVNNLWQNYHFLVEKFFDKVKINKELKDLDLRKNLEQKIELCEKVEELLLETSIIKSFKQLQRLHEQWKDIGPVPDDKKDEIWDRFKSTTDKINQRRRDHYKLLQEDQENNLAAKVALCEKAESLLAEEVNSIKGWQERTRHFNDLFRVWKSIGQAPKKQNDEIWERFKTSLDGFFAEKKDYFGKIKEQQVNNYNLKVELCLQAEALKDTDDWRNTTRELIDLQKRWKEIGPVPRKYADKIWQRFRDACDEFFNKKSAHFSGVRNEESENLRKKEELIAAVENHEFGTDKSKNLELLKDYQRQWTEIGFVPFRDKDRLQNAFRNAINKRLDQLNISNSEMSLSNYISKADSMKHTADGGRQLQREQNFVQNKIAELREDIMLWENNIGFLADTKNANLFKIEFEKKIEKAKSELGVLESKLKILSK